MVNKDKSEVEDIFAGTDRSNKAGKPQTSVRARTSKTPEPVQPAGVPPLTPRKKSSNFMVILVITVVALVLVGVGIVVFGKDLWQKKETGQNTNAAVVTNAANVNIQQPPVANIQAVTTPEVNINTVKDFDGDGLSDDEEKTLGTNPQKSDTDNDGLFDREEVKVYQTDPRNPDTDGDGNPDGVEVKSGYNPNGAGKLLDLQLEIDKIQ